MRKPKDACRVRGCHRTDADRPTIFKGLPWCSENHRKVLHDEVSIQHNHKTQDILPQNVEESIGELFKRYVAYGHADRLMKP